tara:strand:- start:2290 stop:2670 length:381 start_codon:yes stop_codon:yes gene_type:complete
MINRTKGSRGTIGPEGTIGSKDTDESMESKGELFDLLLEKRKVDSDDDKLMISFENIEEGFAVTSTKEGKEDNSIEAQAKKQMEELYAPVLKRFKPEELDFIFNVLFPQEQEEMRHRDMVKKGYAI